MTTYDPQTREPREGARAGASLDTSASPRATAAKEMIGVFGSVGVTAFDVTITDRSQNLVGFQRNQSVGKLSATIPFLLEATDKAEQNLIVRPRGNDERRFIQLDDLDGPGIERVRAFAFLIIETSQDKETGKRNFQAWLTVEDADQDTARSLKAATGADATASGALRVCGSRNFKEKYAPDFPTIRAIEMQPGRSTRKEELSQSGLIKSEKAIQPPARVPSRGFASSTWPDYSIELSRSPRKKDGIIDASIADWHFALIAADRGFDPLALAKRLVEVSEKVRRMANEKEAWRYAERTARRAVETVARRKAGQ